MTELTVYVFIHMGYGQCWQGKNEFCTVVHGCGICTQFEGKVIIQVALGKWRSKTNCFVSHIYHDRYATSECKHLISDKINFFPLCYLLTGGQLVQAGICTWGPCQFWFRNEHISELDCFKLNMDLDMHITKRRFNFTPWGSFPLYENNFSLFKKPILFLSQLILLIFIMNVIL